MKLGFEQAKSSQDFQILATVVSSVFGGKPKSKPPSSFEEAEAKLNELLGSNRRLVPDV